MIQIALNGRTLRPARYAGKPQDTHWLLDTLEAALILAPVKGDRELRFQLRELSYLTWTPSYLQLLHVAPHLNPIVPAIRPDAMDWLMENHRLVGLAELDDGLYDRLAVKNGWTAAELMRITLATCATVAQHDPIIWLAALLETHPDRYPASETGRLSRDPLDGIDSIYAVRYGLPVAYGLQTIVHEGRWRVGRVERVGGTIIIPDRVWSDEDLTCYESQYRDYGPEF